MPAYKRKYVYFDPYENEYIFHQLMQYPDWAKQRLTAPELKVFESPSTIRKFVNSATSDQKKLILAKANIFSITLYLDFNKDEPLGLDNFSKIYKQFSSVEARKKVIDDIIQRNAFAVSTREVISFAYLIAQNCHTPYWFVNKDYTRMYTAAENVKNKNLGHFTGKTDSRKVKETLNSRKYVAKLIGAVVGSENLIRHHLKMDWMDIQILCVLFIHDDTFVYRETICERLYMYSAKSIAKRLASLQHEGYVDIDRASTTNLRYAMAERGIEIFCQYLEKICHQAIES